MLRCASFCGERWPSPPHRWGVPHKRFVLVVDETSLLITVCFKNQATKFYSVWYGEWCARPKLLKKCATCKYMVNVWLCTKGTHINVTMFEPNHYSVVKKLQCMTRSAKTWGDRCPAAIINRGTLHIKMSFTNNSNLLITACFKNKPSTVEESW